MDKKRLVRLRITKVDLCRDGANPDADIKIFKSRDQDPTTPVKKTETPIIEKESSVPKKLTIKKVDKIDLAKATSEDIVAYAKSLESNVDAMEAEFAKAFPPKKKGADDGDDDDDEEDDAPMKKSLIEFQKTIDSLTEQVTKANRDVDAAKLEVAKARNEAELVVIEKRVATEMPSIPGTHVEVAKMLQEAKATLTTASYDVLEKALKAGSAAIAKAADEVGSSRSRSIGTAEEEFFKAADELVVKGVCKTRPEAVVEINKTRKDLAEAYRVEREGKHSR